MATGHPPPTEQPHGGSGIAAGVPIFVEMPIPPPQQLDGIITDGLVLLCSGDRSSGLYGNSGEVLRLMAGDAPVEEFDDPGWSTFPQVSAALQALDPSWRDCFCVAVCRTLGVWAVGVGSRARNRRDAARIALAGAIAAQPLVVGNALPDQLANYTAFTDFLGQVRTTLGI